MYADSGVGTLAEAAVASECDRGKVIHSDGAASSGGAACGSVGDRVVVGARS